MATSKKTVAPEATQTTPPPLPIVVKQLVSECPTTGSKVVYVGQNFYRHADEKTERCGVLTSGEPDGVWTLVPDADVPLKALSMLGKT